MQYLTATDSNGTEVCLFQLEDNSFISIPKDQLEFKPLSPEELKGLEDESKRLDNSVDREKARNRISVGEC